MQTLTPQRFLGAPGRLKGRLANGRNSEFGGINLADGWRMRDGTVLGFSLRASTRAAMRMVLIVLWSLIAIPVQACLMLLPGQPPHHPKVSFARFYWLVICRLLGLKIRVIGTPANGRGRPVVFVSNHSSWLDIPVLGGTLQAVFVSKDEVAGWPIVGTIARLGRTIFVSRNRQATGRERDDMTTRLAGGDNLILFPEGTSSDGSRVLPFRSSFFAIASGARDNDAPPAQPPLIQPVSLVFDRLAGLPMGRANRPIFAWYGNMALAPHVWRIAQQTGCRASLVLHPVLDPVLYPSRKELAMVSWNAVADGAALLRQNRPTRPIAPAAVAGVPAETVNA